MSLTDVWAQVESKVSEATFKGKRAEHAPSRFGINGRSTSVRIGSLSITKDDGKTVIDAAVKLSFRQVGRSQEEAFIKKAHQAFMGKDFPAGGNPLEYLPKIIMSHEYPSFKTDIIRKAVLSNVDDLHHLGTRIPELSVRPAYKPLSSLTEQGDTALLDAFLQLMYCHAMLWSIGIEHGDISPGNLMVNPETGKPKLCDFGLSHFRTETRPKGDSNTATWAFMAIELLTERAMLGEIPRVYRHEVESFVAVLVWIVLRYRKGVLADDSTTKGWTDPSFTKCKDARETTVMRILAGSLPKPSWVSNKIWKVVEDAVSSMERELGRAKTLRAERMLAKGREDAAQIASADEELGRLDGMEFIEKLCAWFLFKGPLGDELAVVLKGQITGPESVAM
ncbi:hypothetical protein DFP72DRAFT_820046 [Ephemerocybe angulata]|uniref:Protein kinase domain-containing protein n=1 Tax=Ephemerocybe angulata TaxID=980116 RepID=A0A8H6HMS2_9AGAR|nr:hypothetical protein DFP72DRAFT_820046 [Tulosesus angulatus]